MRSARPEIEGKCCSEIGWISLDFSTLPFPVGPLPPEFTFERVDFTRIWDSIEHKEKSLWCFGGVEWPPGSGDRHDATVKLVFCTLPCQVCEIVAEVHGHGPKAHLVGTHPDGTTQTAECPGDRRTLTLTTKPDKPFISATLSGQEAQWFSIKLG